MGKSLEQLRSRPIPTVRGVPVRVDEGSSRYIAVTDGGRQDRRRVENTEFALASSPWRYLNRLQAAVQKIPGLALITGSQNPFRHPRVGLMKNKSTPAPSAHQRIALSGTGLGDGPSTGNMTLHRVFHQCFPAQLSRPKTRPCLRRHDRLYLYKQCSFNGLELKHFNDAE